MLKEDYVTYKQAHLLKEKGFPQNVCNKIEVAGYELGYPTNQLTEFAQPSLSLVQKWLREEKDILLIVCLDPRQCGYAYYIYKKDEMPNPSNPLEYGWDSEYGCAFSDETYEQALSAGIDKALELI